MIVPFWVAQNPWLRISHYPEFFAFSFLGNFLSSGRGHDMGGGYTLSTTILHYNFWKRRGSFLGFSKYCSDHHIIFHDVYLFLQTLQYPIFATQLIFLLLMWSRISCSLALSVCLTGCKCTHVLTVFQKRWLQESIILWLKHQLMVGPANSKNTLWLKNTNDSS